MKKYIIFHGSFGSKDDHWFPWIKRVLEEKGENAITPQMPVGVGLQNYDNWAKEADKLNIDEDTILIGHSIAPIFICKYLILNKIKVKKLIFVCGFNNYLGIDPDYDNVNESMFIDNYEDVLNYCSDIVCYYTDNDPYVKYDVEKEFADGIASRQYVIPSAGHINSETGYKKFEEILKEI